MALSAETCAFSSVYGISAKCWTVSMTMKEKGAFLCGMEKSRKTLKSRALSEGSVDHFGCDTSCIAQSRASALNQGRQIWRFMIADDPNLAITSSDSPIPWLHPSLFKEKWKMGSLPGLNIDSVEKQATWDPGRGKHVEKIHQLQLEDVTVNGDWHSVLRSSEDYQTKTKLKVP